MTESDDRLKEIIAGYGADPAKTDLLLQVACTQAPDPLPLYRVLYKFYNRQRRFDLARDFAGRALTEAARQAALPPRFADWTREHIAAAEPMIASQALLSLKALAFITLRSGDASGADVYLEKLREIDPEDGSGGSVVSALAAGL